MPSCHLQINSILSLFLLEYRVDVKRDPFLLLCTDGVWNVLSSQEAVDIAHSAERKGVKMCSACKNSRTLSVDAFFSVQTTPGDVLYATQQFLLRSTQWRTAPEELARESWRRWINQEQIFADDMTALFLRLR